MARYPDEPKLTAGEHVYQGDLERKVERVLEGARRRIEREAKNAKK